MRDLLTVPFLFLLLSILRRSTQKLSSVFIIVQNVSKHARCGTCDKFPLLSMLGDINHRGNFPREKFRQQLLPGLSTFSHLIGSHKHPNIMNVQMFLTNAFLPKFLFAFIVNALSTRQIYPSDGCSCLSCPCHQFRITLLANGVIS